MVVLGGDRATVAVDLDLAGQDDVPTAYASRWVGYSDGDDIEKEPSAKEELVSPGRDASLISPHVELLAHHQPSDLLLKEQVFGGCLYSLLVLSELIPSA